MENTAKSSRTTRYLRALLWMGILALALYRGSSLFKSANNFLHTFEPIVQHPFATTAEKMSYKYPRYYDLIENIKIQTPSDSTIYLPSVNIPYGRPLWALGQIQMTQTLLYPRTVKKYTGSETDGYLVYFSDTDQGVTPLN